MLGEGAAGGIRRIAGGAAPAARAARRGGAGGFRLEAAEASGSAEAAAPPAATASVAAGLLAVQERGAGAERDARAARRGTAILAELRGLQAELLGRAPDPDRLARLAALMEGEAGTDPVLREAMAAVALRAKIEIARAARARALSSN